MKIKLLAALAALGMSGNALAYFDCAIAEPPNHQAEVLVTESKTIRLLADQAASDSTPLEKLIAPAMSTAEIRIVCQNTDFVHGSRPLYMAGLEEYPGKSGFYKTNVEGIGVRFMATPASGSNGDVLPRPEYIWGSKPGTNPFVAILSPSTFTVSFYKLGKVDLSKGGKYPSIVPLMTARDVGASLIENVPYVKYRMNDVSIVGVPVCKVDRPAVVDFNTVNAAAVRNGVSRNFDFGITCDTDYGAYNVTATIDASERTSDNKFIKIKDSKGDNNSLVIEISDSNDNKITVDGNTPIDISNVTSGEKATFKWKALLKKQSGSPYPAQGPFNATATITFNIH
ncbi:fimbrial protein [Morganella morganii]|uniref:Fimbrial protein n=1 Tax=Morganella morganii TaxID=582 RepID=A0AAI9HST2_MORMO|nr:fimbrial protein [Morganella morganii]